MGHAVLKQYRQKMSSDATKMPIETTKPRHLTIVVHHLHKYIIPCSLWCLQLMMLPPLNQNQTHDENSTDQETWVGVQHLHAAHQSNNEISLREIHHWWWLLRLLDPPFGSVMWTNTCIWFWTHKAVLLWKLRWLCYLGFGLREPRLICPWDKRILSEEWTLASL